jgi:hypothetical protein
MSELDQLWLIHREAGYPQLAGPNAGQLMTLDTVICGCVTYYLESAHQLDSQRHLMLEDCMADLAALLPELDDVAAHYFERLQNLARLMLDNSR